MCAKVVGVDEQEKVRALLVNEAFGELLAHIRRAKGYSQAELGEFAGLSRGTISNLEAGSQNVLLHQLFACALALDVPAIELLPALGDVVIYEGKGRSSDQVFLDFAKRQLVDFKLLDEDQDENS